MVGSGCRGMAGITVSPRPACLTRLDTYGNIKGMSNQSIRELRPTYLYATVDFRDVNAPPSVVMASYKGYTLTVQYGSEHEQDVLFFSGNAEADYDEMVDLALLLDPDDKIAFMGSSTIDTFQILIRPEA